MFRTHLILENVVRALKISAFVACVTSAAGASDLNSSQYNFQSLLPVTYVGPILASSNAKTTSDSNSYSNSNSNSYSNSNNVNNADDFRIQRRARKSDGNIAISFVPFGVGQFYNGRPLLGSFFLVGQLTALGLVYKTMQDQSAYVGQSNDDLANMKQQYDVYVSNGDENNADAQKQKIDDYYFEIDDYNKKIENQKTTYLAVFTGLWVVSVAESLIVGPEKATHVRVDRERRCADQPKKDSGLKWTVSPAISPFSMNGSRLGFALNLGY